MKKIFYGTLYVYLLAGLPAFAIAPAVAEAMSNQSMEAIAPAPAHRGPVANPVEKASSQEANHESKSHFRWGKTATNHFTQDQGGEAIVARVNRPGKCLRVYSHPSHSSKQISCMAKGEKVHLNGTFSKDRRWAQLDNQGWVLFRNLKTHVKARRTGLMNTSLGRSAAIGESWNRSATMGKSKPKTAGHDPGYNEMPMGEIF